MNPNDGKTRLSPLPLPDGEFAAGHGVEVLPTTPNMNITMVDREVHYDHFEIRKP